MKFIGNLALTVFLLQIALVAVFFVKPDMFQAAYEFFSPEPKEETAMPAADMVMMGEPSAAPTAMMRKSIDPAEESVDQVLASMRDGNIAFNTPTTMALGEEEEIELVLSLDKTTEQLIEQLNTEDPTRTASVKVSRVMEAKLIGDSEVFDIQPVVPERQAVSDAADTKWLWTVTPRKRGTHTMRVTLSAIFSIDGVEASKPVNVYRSDAIDVVINVPNFVKGFVMENWLSALMSIVVPAFGAFLRISSMFRKK